MLEKTPFPNGQEENGLVLPTMDLSPEAKTTWIDIYNEIESNLAPGRDLSDARDIASKGADNNARLAALFSLYEGTHEISKTNIERASQIIIWHLYEAKRFFGEVQKNPEDLLVGKLDDWLLAQKRGRIPKSSILTHGPGSLRKKHVLDEALSALVETGRIRLHKDGKKTFIGINPALLTRENDR